MVDVDLRGGLAGLRILVGVDVDKQNNSRSHAFKKDVRCLRSPAISTVFSLKCVEV